MTLGENIRRFREEKGVTQQQLADRMDVDRSTIAQWESGVSMPRMGKAMELVRYFCITFDDLMADEPREARQTQPDALTDEERRLLEAFRKLDASARQIAIGAVEGMATV